ncbi:MAG: DUF3810 family protein, partial [Flavobacteriales bacterium]|nr:DUF3810 family protein [Flavobacteriales bacterium]
RESLDPVVAQHLDEINENIRLYPPLFPKFSQAVNDLYLKSNGIEDGIQSYDRYVDLAFQWKETNWLY